MAAKAVTKSRTDTRFQSTRLCLALSLLLVSACFGHQVDVHQLMSLEAGKRATRLQSFLRAFDLTCTSLASPVSMNAEAKERMYSPLFGNDSWETSSTFLAYANGSPVDMIRLGSILEDEGTNWCNHFYTPTSATTGRPLDFFAANLALETACQSSPIDAAKWATGSRPLAGANQSLLSSARHYLIGAFTTSDPLNRKLHLGRAFTALGHAIHLVQDMTQPSHTRNDAHACACSILPLPNAGPLSCSAFELWGSQNSKSVSKYVERVGEINGIRSLNEAIVQEANFSARNFFSDEARSWKTILGNMDLIVGSDDYVRHASGELEGIRIARMWPRGTPMAMPRPANEFRINDQTAHLLMDASINDEGVLSDNASVLWPRAVVASAEVLNYFFRAQIIADLDVDRCDAIGITIKLKNNSEDANGSNGSACTLGYLNRGALLVSIIDPNTNQLTPLSLDEVSCSVDRLEPGEEAFVRIRRPLSDFTQKAVLCVYIGRESTVVDGIEEPLDPFAACVVGTPMKVFAGASARLDGEDLEIVKFFGDKAVHRVSQPCEFAEDGTIRHEKQCSETNSSEPSHRVALSLQPETEGRGSCHVEQTYGNCRVVSSDNINQGVATIPLLLPKPNLRVGCVAYCWLRDDQELRVRTNGANLEGSVEVASITGVSRELPLSGYSEIVLNSHELSKSVSPVGRNELLKSLEKLSNLSATIRQQANAMIPGMPQIEAPERKTDCDFNQESWFLGEGQFDPQSQLVSPFAGSPCPTMNSGLDIGLGATDAILQDRVLVFVIIKADVISVPGEATGDLCWDIHISDRMTSRPSPSPNFCSGFSASSTRVQSKSAGSPLGAGSPSSVPNPYVSPNSGYQSEDSPYKDSSPYKQGTNDAKGKP